MNLRSLAETDLAYTLEDGVHGFGWDISITDPRGVSNTEPLRGYSNDITELIDPETGQAVVGRLASATLRISTLTAQGFAIPRGIEDTAATPWLITFNDINGGAWTFKVSESNPDRTLGIVVCVLSFWDAND